MADSVVTGADSVRHTGGAGGRSVLGTGGTAVTTTAQVAADAALTSTYANKANAIDPTDVGYDVVILLGQSNMSGTNGTPDTAYLDPTDPRIYRWVNPATQVSALSTYKSILTLASDPLGHADALAGVGPGMPFAREWVASSS